MEHRESTIVTERSPRGPALLTSPGLTTVFLTRLMFTVDITIVNVALPAIGSALGFPSAQLIWVGTISARAAQGVGAAMAAPSTLVLRRLSKA